MLFSFLQDCEDAGWRNHAREPRWSKLRPDRKTVAVHVNQLERQRNDDDNWTFR